MKTKTPSRTGNSRFEGFPEDGFRFLQQLRKHNDREWFGEHKADYSELVEEPMKRLVYAVAEKCKSDGLPLFVKDRNPVMRVYRDIRFSKDKTPYKTHVAGELRRSFETSEVLLYIHLQPEGSFLGAGIWQAERTVLHSLREAIVSEPKKFEGVVSGLAKQGLKLGEEHSLSTMPRGFRNCSDEAFGRWLKLTTFIVTRQLRQSECTRGDLVDHVVKFALAAKPLLEFCWGIEQASSKPKLLSPPQGRL